MEYLLFLKGMEKQAELGNNFQRLSSPKIIKKTFVYKKYGKIVFMQK